MIEGCTPCNALVAASLYNLRVEAHGGVVQTKTPNLPKPQVALQGVHGVHC